MANEKSRHAKRVTSGVLALTIVASQVVLPANVDAGGLFGSNAITAKADPGESSASNSGDSSSDAPVSSDSDNTQTVEIDSTDISNAVISESGDYHTYTEGIVTVNGEKDNADSGCFSTKPDQPITISLTDQDYIIKSIKVTTTSGVADPTISGASLFGSVKPVSGDATTYTFKNVNKASAEFTTSNVGYVEKIEVTYGVDPTVTIGAREIVAAQSADSNSHYTATSGIVTVTGKRNGSYAYYFITDSGEPITINLTESGYTIKSIKVTTVSGEVVNPKINNSDPSETNGNTYTFNNVNSASAEFTNDVDSGSGKYVSQIEVTYVECDAAVLPTVTTAPEAVQDLKYTGSAQALVTAGTASAGSTMKYAVVPDGKIPVTKIVEGDNISSEPEVGAVYKPTRGYGISFPNHHIMYNGNEYYDFQGMGNVFLYTATGKTIIADSSLVELPDDCNAIYVESISGNIMTVKAVNTANCVQAAYGDATTATATNAGKYDVYYKAVRSDGVESEAQYIDATIDKADVNVTRKEGLSYNGQAHDLVTREGNVGTVMYKTKTLGKVAVDKIVEGNGISVADSEIKENTLYKPTGVGGISFSSDLKYNGTPYHRPTILLVDDVLKIKYESYDPIADNYVPASTEIGNYDSLIVENVGTSDFTVHFVNSANYEAAPWTEVLPTRTEAGAYDVFWRVEGDNNVNETGGNLLVTIAKATATVAPAENLTYTGQAQDLFNVPANSGEVIEYAIAEPAEVLQKGGMYELTDEDLSEGNVIKATDEHGFTFPKGKKVKILNKNNTIVYPDANTHDNENYVDHVVVTIWPNGYYYFYGSDQNGYNEGYAHEVKFPEGCDAVRIDNVSDDLIEVTAVNSATCFEVDQSTGKTYKVKNSGWSKDVPKGTNAGNYSYAWRITAKNSKNYNTQDVTLVQATIAKANLTADTDYTAPTLAGEEGKEGELDYTAKEQALITAGSLRENINPEDIAEADQVKMEYGVVPKDKDVTVIERDSGTALSINDVEVGNVYKPKGGSGVYFPEGYSLIYNNVTHTNNAWVSFYLSGNGKYYIQYVEGTTNETPLDTGYDALKVTAIDYEKQVISVEAVNADTAYNKALENYTWSTDAPTKKDVGEYNVYYRINGGANYENVAPTKIGTTKIDYAESKLTLADSLGAVKVTDEAGEEVSGVVPPGYSTVQYYPITATKVYKIYTEKTIATDEINKYKLDSGWDTVEGDKFEYVYTLTVPVTPAENGYTLSHLSNWTGKQYPNEPDVLYIADGAVTVGTRQKAATLKGQNTYYYGDTPSKNDVEIVDAYKGIVKVDSVTFLDNTGAAVKDLSKLEYGTYTLEAKLLIDSNESGEFNDPNIDGFVYISKEVEYKARPMTENEYYLKETDDQDKETLTKLDVKYAKAKAAETDSGSGSGTGTSGGTPVGISGTPVETPISNTEPELDLDDLKDTATEEYKYPVVVVPEDTYTYNSKDRKPEIVVKNPNLGKTEENPDGTALVIKSETANGDYTSAVTAHKDAGTYSEKITAVPGVTDEGGNVTTQANYTGDVTVVWTINKADIHQYISVAPKNNIVYDGNDLNGDDFVVSANEEYAKLTDSDEDKLKKALVDELIAGAKKEEAAAQQTETGTTGSTIVDSGTTVVSNVFKTELVVTPAIGTVYKENIPYETTSADGITLYSSEESRNAYAGKVIGGDIVVAPSSKTTDNKNITSHELSIRINSADSNIQYKYNGSIVDTFSVIFSDLDFSSNYKLTYNSENGTLIIKDRGGVKQTFSAKEGYKLYIESINGRINEGGSLEGNDTDVGETIGIIIKAVPTSGFVDVESNIKDASVKDEVKRANVTVKHNNFKDIEFKQTLDENGKVNPYVVDNSLKVKIAKREVTITPKNVENKPFEYGTYVGTSDADKANFYKDYVTYDYEKAKEDSITGLVDADINKTEDGKESSKIDFSGAFKLFEKTSDKDGFTFGDRWANQVDGDYKFVAVTDFDGAPNYDVVIDENAEFVVTAKQITAAMFTLYTDKGLETAYETAYKYNGDKQKVYVKGVDTVGTVTFEASEFEAETTGEGNNVKTTYDPLTKEGVTVTPDSVVALSESEEDPDRGIAIGNVQSTGGNDPKVYNLDVSAANNIDKIVLTIKANSDITAANISDYLNLEGFPQGTTLELVITESDSKKVVITPADNTTDNTDDNTQKFTIAAKADKTIYVRKVEVTCTDVNTLENGVDFKVIGTTEGILPDTFYVGFKGVGNYAGTILDKLEKGGLEWEIKSVDLGAAFTIASTTVKNGTGAFPGYYYNGEAPEFTTDSSLRANENKILYFRLNGYNSDEFDEIENELNTAKSNLEKAKQSGNENDIKTYTAAVEKYENLAAFINANPDFKPELTYYQLVEEKAAPSETAGTATDTDTDAEEVEKITISGHTFVKLDEAPVDVGKYLVKATFQADGFKFNNQEKLETFDFFEIRTADYDLADNFGDFTYEKDYGKLTVEDTTKPELSFKVTEIFNDAEMDPEIPKAVLSALTEAGYIPDPYYYYGFDDEAEAEEDGKIHRIVPVVKGTVKVDFTGELNGTYVNAGKYDYDTTGVEYGTVELIYDETGKIVKLGEFTPSNNYKVVWSSKYTVNKLKLTKEMFETVPVALVDGVADLSKAVKPSEEYAKLLRESDYAIVGAQTTANVGAVNVQYEATEEGNFTGVVKLQGEVVDYGTNQVVARSATLGEELLLNIKFKLDKTVTADADAYFEYEFNGVTTKVKVAEMTPDSGDRYVVSIPIVAKDAHKNVTVKLFNGGGNQIPLTDKEGNAVAETGYQYSIYEYFDLLINTYPAGNKYHEIGVAAKDYCIASNNALDKGSAGYTVSENVDLVDVNEIYNYAAVDSDLITGLDHVTSSVTCLSDNKLRVYFYFENGVDISDYTCIIDGVETELIKSSETKYYAEIANIAAKKLNVSHVFELKNNNTDETYTTERSALTYSNILLTGSYKDTLKYVQFAKAFYNYNKAAIVAFGN